MEAARSTAWEEGEAAALPREAVASAHGPETVPGEARSRMRVTEIALYAWALPEERTRVMGRLLATGPRISEVQRILGQDVAGEQAEALKLAAGEARLEAEEPLPSVVGVAHPPTEVVAEPMRAWEATARTCHRTETSARHVVVGAVVTVASSMAEAVGGPLAS